MNISDEELSVLNNENTLLCLHLKLYFQSTLSS